MSFVAVITPVQGNPDDPGSVTPPINLPPGVWPNPPGRPGLPPGAWTKPPGDILWPPQLPPLPPGIISPPIVLPPTLNPPPQFPIFIPEDPSKPIVMPPVANPPIIWPPIDPSAGLPGGRSLVLIWILGTGWRWLLVDLSQPKK